MISQSEVDKAARHLVNTAKIDRQVNPQDQLMETMPTVGSKTQHPSDVRTALLLHHKINSAVMTAPIQTPDHSLQTGINRLTR